jgi:hypothetical protein
MPEGQPRITLWRPRTYLCLPRVKRLIPKRIAEDDIIADRLHHFISKPSLDRVEYSPEPVQSTRRPPMSSLAVSARSLDPDSTRRSLGRPSWSLLPPVSVRVLVPILINESHRLQGDSDPPRRLLLVPATAFADSAHLSSSFANSALAICRSSFSSGGPFRKTREMEENAPPDVDDVARWAIFLTTG